MITVVFERQKFDVLAIAIIARIQKPHLQENICKKWQHETRKEQQLFPFQIYERTSNN